MWTANECVIYELVIQCRNSFMRPSGRRIRSISDLQIRVLRQSLRSIRAELSSQLYGDYPHTISPEWLSISSSTEKRNGWYDEDLKRFSSTFVVIPRRSAGKIDSYLNENMGCSCSYSAECCDSRPNGHIYLKPYGNLIHAEVAQ